LLLVLLVVIEPILSHKVGENHKEKI